MAFRFFKKTCLDCIAKFGMDSVDNESKFQRKILMQYYYDHELMAIVGLLTIRQRM